MEGEATGDETDRFFVPFGLIAGILVATWTLEGGLRPSSFWAPEAAGYFVSVVLVFALPPKARWVAHTMLVILGMLAFAVLVYQATISS
jgi:hypothetical protein